MKNNGTLYILWGQVIKKVDPNNIDIERSKILSTIIDNEKTIIKKPVEISKSLKDHYIYLKSIKKN